MQLSTFLRECHFFRHVKTHPLSYVRSYAALVFVVLGAAACSSVPSVGPSRKEIENAASVVSSPLQIIDVTDDIAGQLRQRQQRGSFANSFELSPAANSLVGPGDTLEINIWEAPPATLFGGGDLGAKSGSSIATSRVTTLPEQIVSTQGRISVPFAGAIGAAGRSTSQIEEEIVKKLKGKANQPQVIVRLLRNTSAMVTVVGEVTNSTRMALSPRGERVLDAVAAAGGAKPAVNKTTLQLTRGNTTVAMPLDSVIRDPRQNVPLLAGDVLTALFQPLSFTALGATGKNDEINFEAQGITLAQALGRLGGLQDSRSDAQGVFVFRYETPAALDWPKQPVSLTKDGMVPVIYRINLKDPNSFFVAQTFSMENKDLVYVSNAPIAEIQKFANLVYTIVLPALSTANALR